MADREILSPAVAMASSSSTVLPPPKPTRLRTASSNSNNSSSSGKTSTVLQPPVPLPRPTTHSSVPLKSQDNTKDNLLRTVNSSNNNNNNNSNSSNGAYSLEEARTRLRSTGSSLLEGLSSSSSSSPVSTPPILHSKATTPPSPTQQPPPPPPPSVAIKPIIPSYNNNNNNNSYSNNNNNHQNHSNSSPAPPPKPKRASQQALLPPQPPPVPNAKPLSLQCSSPSAASSQNTSSVATPITHQQQPQKEQQTRDNVQEQSQHHHHQGVRLPIVPRARKPSHLQLQQQQQQQQQTSEPDVPMTGQVFVSGHQRHGANGSGRGISASVGSTEGPGTETGVATATGGGVKIGMQSAVHAHPPQHQNHAPISSTHSSLLQEGHAHQRSHSGTTQIPALFTGTTTTISAAVHPGPQAKDLQPAAVRGKPLEKQPESAYNGQEPDATMAAASSMHTRQGSSGRNDGPSTSETDAAATLAQARSRLRSTARSSPPSSPSTAREDSAPSSSPASTPAANTTPRSRHVYPPPEKPSLHPDHYHESYIKQKWDLQEDDETEALVTTSSSLSSANDRHSQEGRGNGINGGGGGSGAAAFERRRIIVDTLEPSTPPSSSFLTTIPNPSSAYNNHNTSNMPASPSSSALTASLQKIQSMVHEQTERIRQVNYAEKKADFAEAVYEKSALWRVRGVEWGGLAKKAWEDRGGVGGIAGGLAERWRRRGDYPIIGGYNPEGKTTGHVDQIFGIPLAEAVKHSRISPSTGVPAVVTRCIEYLDVMGVEEVGLYRISGSSTTVAKMKALFDQGQDYDFLQKGHEPPNPHDVATLLKLYLRELPAPIIPATLLPAFTQAASSDDPGPALRDQLKQLPLENYLLLATLSRHLSTLADYEAVTKMSISNLGLIFCPTLQIGSALFKQLLGGDEPTSTKKHTSGCALVPITSTTSAGDNYTSPTEDHRDDEEDGMRTLQQDVDGERKALRERQLAVVWADKEARHEEMENLELVKDFELALEMQQDEEKQLQLQKQQQLQQTLQQEATSHEHTNRHQQHHHQDLEWDRVDDFEDDCSFESSKAAAAAPTSSLSTSAPPPSTAAQSPPLIDLYDEMVMREIDEAASTPLITPPQTIRSAPLPSVPRRQPFQQSPQQQQQQRRRHAREPAAVLDQSIGTSMGRSLILEGSSRNDVEDGEEDDDNNGAEGGSNTRMSRSLYTSTEAHVRAQEDTRPRRSRPPPTFLAGVGMASPTSPPLSTSRFSPSTTPGNNGNGPSANGDTASTRRTNAGYIGNNSNSSSPKHANSTTSHGGVTNMNGSNNNSISPKQQQQQQQQRPRMTTNDRSFSGGSLSNSLSSASSAAIITTAAITNNATANATAAVFHDLFARPAQPTVSREDARGTKIKRIVNPFENMAASSSITAGTPPGLHPPPPPPTLSSSHAFSSTSSTPLASRTSQTSPTSESTWTSSPHVNEYVQQLQLHEEDNIRTTLDSSARHRRQPAGFERIGIVGHGDAR